MAKHMFSSAERICRSTMIAAVLLGAAPMQLLASESSIPAVAPAGDVRGIVRDASGEPIAGATILIKGTTRGTTTDQNGQFVLSDASGSTLVVSFIGYESREVKGSANVKVTLSEDSQLLDDVVVVGYGSVKKSDLTGAVASVSNKDITASNRANAVGAIQGAVPGVNIQRTNNKPGGGYKILIRGLNTISGSTSPLIVVDGVPGASLDYINPDDIEKIDVLKDASSTAIFGSRATNGVVIVTTKKGQKGKPKVTYDANAGWSVHAHTPEMMNGEEYVQLAREYGRATKGNGQYVSDSDLFSAEELWSIEHNDYTDWFDELTTTGWQTGHTLSINGGTDQATYVASMGYYNEVGMLRPQFYHRYNLRAGGDFTPSKYFKAGVSMYGTYSDQETGNEDGLQTIYRLRPTYHRYNPLTGEETLKYGNGVYNPYITQKNQVWNYKKYDVLANAYIEIDPIQDLSIRTSISPDFLFVDYGMYADANTKRKGGSASGGYYEKSTAKTWVWDNQITYKKDFAKGHHLDVTGVYSMTKYTYEFMRGDTNGLTFNSLWYNLQGGTKSSSVKSSYSQNTLMSLLGRVNYNYKGKYLLTGSMRYDGSSKLAEGHKWGGFYAGALAWRLSEEEFLKDIDWIDNLKLRLSIGQSGNDNVSAYQTNGSISGAQYYSFGSTDDIGYLPNNLRNLDLGWERTTEYNVGFDFGFFKSRLSGSVELYNRLTEDLIMSKTVPVTTGYTSVKANVGSVRNTGFELQLNTVNIQTHDFTWSTSFNIAHNRNRIVELQYKEDLTERGQSLVGKEGDYSNLWIIGEAVDCNFNLITEGVWQLGEEEEAAKYGCKPGQFKAKDLNGDGVINNADRVIDGQRTPTWTGGMTNTFAGYGFDLTVGTAFQAGAKMRNQFLVSYQLENNNMNLNNMKKDYWTPENPTNASAQPGNMGTYRDLKGQWGNTKSAMTHTMTKTDYFKVTHITLGYSLPKSLISKSFISQLRIYGTVQNPFLWCADDLLDPEQMSTSVSNTDVLSRTFLLGLNVSF